MSLRDGNIDLRTTHMGHCVPCPACGKLLDAASSLDGYTPKPGDISLCFGCTSILVFDEGLRPRLALEEEVLELEPELKGEIVRMRKMLEARNERLHTEQEVPRRARRRG